MQNSEKAKFLCWANCVGPPTGNEVKEILGCSNIGTLSHFYPTALKGCHGIVFTHGVRMGVWLGGRQEKVCPGCISETVRCRKVKLGRDIG